MTDIGLKLEELAAQIVDGALDAGDPQTKMDAFKTVSGYHIQITKAKLRTGSDDDEEGFSFDAAKRSVKSAQSGR